MRDNDTLILENAYLQILEEGRTRRYLEMFKKFLTNLKKESYDNERYYQEVESRIQKTIKKAIDVFKKDNIIVWFLKRFRFSLENDSARPILLPSIRPQDKTLGDIILSYDQWLIEFHHLFSLGIPEIENFQDYKDENGLMDIQRKFLEYESEWAKQNEQWIDVTDDLGREKITELIEFDDGFIWFNLNRSRCEKEGKAMGHCGNCGGDYNDIVLSLRKLKEKGNRIYARPSLTFILDEDGFLGEMKGRANTKPKEEYHPYILKLLGERDFIKGIKGGGYLPQHNFSLTDLKEPLMEKVLKTNILLRDEELANVLMYYRSRKKYPKELLKVLASNPETIFDTARKFVQNYRPIPRVIIDIASKHPFLSARLALLLSNNMNYTIPKTILNSVIQDLDETAKLIKAMLKENYFLYKEIPAVLLQKIANTQYKDEITNEIVRAMDFAHKTKNNFGQNDFNNYVEALRHLPNSGRRVPEFIRSKMSANQLEKLGLPIMLHSPIEQR
jgi:hypothetical protein